MKKLNLRAPTESFMSLLIDTPHGPQFLVFDRASAGYQVVTFANEEHAQAFADAKGASFLPLAYIAKMLEQNAARDSAREAEPLPPPVTCHKCEHQQQSRGNCERCGSDQVWM